MQGQSDALTSYCNEKQLVSLSFVFFKKGSQTNQLSQQGLGLRSFECLGQLIHMVLSQYSGQYIPHIQRVQDTHSFRHEAQSEMSDITHYVYVYVNVTFISSYLQLSKCNFSAQLLIFFIRVLRTFSSDSVSCAL